MSEAMNSRRRTAAPAEPAPSRTPARAPSAPARPPMPTPPRRSSEAVDEGPAELTEAQIDELRGRLEDRRAQLLESIDSRREQERDNTGREVGDEMDEANTEGHTAMTSKLLERDVALLREIDRALAKIGEGVYGRCEGTGEPIGYARLALRPWARYSVAYQEEMEREERNRGGVGPGAI